MGYKHVNVYILLKCVHLLPNLEALGEIGMKQSLTCVHLFDHFPLLIVIVYQNVKVCMCLVHIKGQK